MLVSSTSMNAARETTTAISQGLNFGVQRSCGGGGGGVPVASGIKQLAWLFQEHLRIHRHARAQTVILVLPGLQIDADWNSLHHLHVISSGILRREQTEPCTGGSADSRD